MPEAEIKKRGGAIRWRTFHPPGRPDVYMHAAIVRKKGPRGGKTVVGKEHHKGESLELQTEKFRYRLFGKLENYLSLAE
jgi:hypothetical protein